MKHEIERRKPSGLLDHLSLSLTTFGVGYLPIAPGTWGSAVGVVIYLGAGKVAGLFSDRATAHDPNWDLYGAALPAIVAIALLLFCLAGIWAAGRSMEFFGNTDPSQAVVDEVMGQLITFLFIPFSVSFIPFAGSWTFIFAGFLLFRLFDIWKPYPIDDLQGLPGGIGICADDIVAGVYAGICLSVLYAISFAL